MQIYTYAAGGLGGKTCRRLRVSKTTSNPDFFGKIEKNALQQLAIFCVRLIIF